jgi:hypothetical protein
MRCPIQTGETPEVLLDYCTRKLNPSSAALLERHLQLCPECRKFAESQSVVWQALDAWEAEPVSMDFDRKLYERIEEDRGRSWWERFSLSQPFGWRPAMPVAAVCIALFAVMLLKSPTPAPRTHSAEIGTKSEFLEAEQVERTLEDLEMLRQLSQPSREL